MYNIISILANSRLRRHLWAPSAAVKETKKNKKIGAPPASLSGGACGAPNGFKNVTRSMRIPNMCLILKSDNGKVVSIVNGQSDRTIQYRISI